MIDPLPNAFSICPRAFFSMVGSPLEVPASDSRAERLVRVILAFDIAVVLDVSGGRVLLLEALTMSISWFERVRIAQTNSINLYDFKQEDFLDKMPVFRKIRPLLRGGLSDQTLAF